MLAAEDHNVHGLIVGDAHPRKVAYLEEINQLASSLGIGGRVTFTGHRADLREVLAASDLDLLSFDAAGVFRPDDIGGSGTGEAGDRV